MLHANKFNGEAIIDIAGHPGSRLAEVVTREPSVGRWLLAMPAPDCEMSITRVGALEKQGEQKAPGLGPETASRPSIASEATVESTRRVAKSIAIPIRHQRVRRESLPGQSKATSISAASKSNLFTMKMAAAIRPHAGISRVRSCVLVYAKNTRREKSSRVSVQF